MDPKSSFHREYLLRLPLPLAQLYSRAYNAKDARGRHDNGFYLFEALVKLAAAPLVAGYVRDVRAERASRVPTIDRLLAALALPSLGQWVAIVRELSRHFSSRPDGSSHPFGHVFGQLSAPGKDRLATIALYRRIKNGPDGERAADESCSFLALFDALVQYRNAVFGHGAGRFEGFYEKEMGPLLMPALNEVLAEGVLDLLGPKGSRLVYLTELRGSGPGRFDLGLRELVGLQGERSAPMSLTAEQAAELAPNQVAVLWPGARFPLRLDPLLRYREDDTSAELLFLNRDRNGRQVEYLSYTTGRTERDPETAGALASLLSVVTGREVGMTQLEQLASQTRAETPSLEALFAAPPAPGSQTIGDYEIVAELGRGGMGIVYLARQLSLGRLVALKMLPADLAGDDMALARFRREMRSLARCEHPNIVKVLASGTFPDGRLYYAMEYVPGCDLEQVWRELSGSTRPGGAGDRSSSTWSGAVLAAARKNREHSLAGRGARQDGPPVEVPALPIPPLPELPAVALDPGGYSRRVAELMRDAASALQAVHDQNIVHRDVKPANFMLTPDGARIVLMDFGLAKGQSLALTASAAGGLLGTLRYAAPEQLAAASLKVGPSADVHGLGVTMWELLTRRRLFGDAADEQQLATLVHEQDVPLLRTVDPSFDRDLEAVVARATERRVADRIPTARDLAGYLDLYLDGKPLPIRPATAGELVLRWIRANPGKAVAAAAAVVLLCVTGLMWRAAARAEDLRKEGEARLIAGRNQDLSAELGEVRANLVAHDFGAARKSLDKAVLVAAKPPALGRLAEIQSVQGRLADLVAFEADANEAWFAAGQERNLDARNACARATARLTSFEDHSWWDEVARAGGFKSRDEVLEMRDRVLDEEHRQLLLHALLLMNRAMVTAEPLQPAPGRTSDLSMKEKAALAVKAAILLPKALGYVNGAAAELIRARGLEEREPRLASKALGVMEQMCDSAYVLAKQDPKFKRAPESRAGGELSATDAYFFGMGNFILGNKQFADDTLSGILRAVEGLALAAPPLDVADHELRLSASRDPGQYWPVYLLGWTLLSAERFDEAELAFDVCVAVRPANPRAYELRGLALLSRSLRMTRPELAGIKAEIQARAVRDLDHALLIAGPDDPSVNWARGDYFRLTGQDALAIETYMHGLEVDEKVVEAVSRRPVLEEVRKLGERIAAADPRHVEARALLAMLLLTTRHPEEAAKAAAGALALDADHARALCVRGALAEEDGRLPAALADFDRALARNPGLFGAGWGRARILARMGDHARAKDACDALIAGPARPPWQRRAALAGRARESIELGRRDEALASAREAAAIDASDPQVAKLLEELAPAPSK